MALFSTLLAVLVIESQGLYMLDKQSTTELHLQPQEPYICICIYIYRERERERERERRS
jgi:hypothetical protein